MQIMRLWESRPYHPLLESSTKNKYIFSFNEKGTDAGRKSEEDERRGLDLVLTLTNLEEIFR